MPNPFDEYINRLEDQTEVDPQKIASDLLEIHKHEVSTREAKITELNETVAKKDSTITNLSNEVTAQKARNYDLVDFTNNKLTDGNQSDNDGQPDGATIKIADLFKKDVRNRHNGI